MQDEETPFGYVYRITNLVNGKTYVGKHKAKANEDWLEYMGSGKLIVRAIVKYGKENFSKELLSYAKSPDELSEIEIDFIQLEKSMNKAEYNLMLGNSEDIDWSSITDLESYPVLDWFFNDKLSTREIANRVGCSQPTVIAYFDKFRATDSRFDAIKQGSNRTPVKKTSETIERARRSFKSLKKIECESCHREFHPSNIGKHIEACKVIPLCPSCNVRQNDLRRKTCFSCKANLGSLKKSNISGTHSVKAMHTRWHVKREIINEDCTLCVTS